VQHSCLGRVKARLKAQDNVYVVDRWIPTTQQCINCGDRHPMPPASGAHVQSSVINIGEAPAAFSNPQFS
jgi:hypothetical protein